jgi:hypothetical protein
MAATERIQRRPAPVSVSVKPGWCPIHPGRPEPCFVCNMANGGHRG